MKMRSTAGESASGVVSDLRLLPGGDPLRRFLRDGALDPVSEKRDAVFGSGVWPRPGEEEVLLVLERLCVRAVETAHGSTHVTPATIRVQAVPQPDERSESQMNKTNGGFQSVTRSDTRSWAPASCDGPSSARVGGIPETYTQLILERLLDFDYARADPRALRCVKQTRSVARPSSIPGERAVLAASESRLCRATATALRLRGPRPAPGRGGSSRPAPM